MDWEEHNRKSREYFAKLDKEKAMADEVKTYEVKLERRDLCPFCNNSPKEHQRLREQVEELKAELEAIELGV